MSPIVSILTSVILGVIGQLVLKGGITTIGPLSLAGQGIPGTALRIISNPSVLLGLSIYGISMVFWLVSLSQVELGYAYPFISLSYVLVVFSSRAVFHEELSLWRLVGVGLICLGVYTVAAG